MRTLILCTQGYKQALEEVLAEEDCTPLEHTPLFCVCCPQSAINLDALAQLLERIAIAQHPVYGPSPKLTSLALAQQSLHEANVRTLTQYLRTNDRLHLEGYATFRMEGFRHTLDMLMYRIIKKMRLNL